MKSAEQWIYWLHDNQNKVRTGEAIASLEERDREVRASALREAADSLSVQDGHVAVWLRARADRAERGES